eukprot:m.90811 g.90811  ORF g.90811 m.90811 type:complete len:295 (-) comp12929_c0_seq1:56-940(-)
MEDHVMLYLALGALVCVTAATATTQKGARQGFDLELQQKMMNYTWSSFCDPAVIENNTCYWCTDANLVAVRTVHGNKSDAYGYVAYNPVQSYAVVAYRGSSNLMNWLYDFDFIKMNVSGTTARVHSGFYDCWLELKDEVFSAMNTVLKKCPHCTQVYVTGHSLGAAISGLCAFDLARDKPSLSVHLHNFGMPRVGDIQFAQVFNSTVASATRMVHRHDIVPHLPPAPFGFHHISTEVWDQSPETTSPPSAQTYKVCDGSGEDPTCSESIDALHWVIEDHDYYMGTTNSECHYSN